MVIFDQLRISDKGDQMYINAHINKATYKDAAGNQQEYFKDMYIKKLTIMAADDVSEDTPCVVPDDVEKILHEQEFPEGTKEINLIIPFWDFSHIRLADDPCVRQFTIKEMIGTLFFVFIETEGTPSDCVPCYADKTTSVGVTFDENVLYQRVMDYTRQLASDCTIPTEFTDFILLWNAFKASVETEHYIPAIKYYNLLFGKGNTPQSRSGRAIKGCGCHG